jgi:hypothetical protein
METGVPRTREVLPDFPALLVRPASTLDSRAAAASRPGLRTGATPLAAVGACYLIHGERAKAERMFDRGFQLEQDDPWITACIAGAYLGVRPPPME